MTSLALAHHPGAAFVSRPENISRAEAMMREASGRMMSSHQRSKLRHALRLERGTRSDRKEAERICANIERELSAGISESMALELARGGEVDVRASGAVRMKARDGLQSLLEANRLSVEHYDVAMDVRAMYEARSEDLGSQMGGTGTPGSAHDNDRYVHNRARRAIKLQRLGTLERAVALDCRDEPAALQMIRAVVGEGHTVNSFGEGRAFDRHLKALLRALDVAAQLFGKG